MQWGNTPTLYGPAAADPQFVQNFKIPFPHKCITAVVDASFDNTNEIAVVSVASFTNSSITIQYDQASGWSRNFVARYFAIGY